MSDRNGVIFQGHLFDFIRGGSVDKKLLMCTHSCMHFNMCVCVRARVCLCVCVDNEQTLKMCRGLNRIINLFIVNTYLLRRLIS